jgi:hypothetical protein
MRSKLPRWAQSTSAGQFELVAILHEELEEPDEPPEEEVDESRNWDHIFFKQKKYYILPAPPLLDPDETVLASFGDWVTTEQIGAIVEDGIVKLAETLPQAIKSPILPHSHPSLNSSVVLKKYSCQLQSCAL